MPSVTLKWDSRDFRNRIEALAKAMEVEPADIVRQQMGSAIRTIARYTYPSKKKDGDNAVENDIRRIFTTPADIFPVGSRIPALDKLLKSSQWEKAANTIVSFPRYQNLTVADAVDPSIHNRLKNRHGRVPKSTKWKVLIKDPQALKLYIKAVQAKVGRAKSAWLAGAQKFGASLPAWVRRHGTSEGEARDTLRGTKGYVEAATTNEAAVDMDRQHDIVERALKNTDKSLTIKLKKTL